MMTLYSFLFHRRNELVMGTPMNYDAVYQQTINTIKGLSLQIIGVSVRIICKDSEGSGGVWRTDARIPLYGEENF
jgi:hypothetical protein